MSLEEELFQAIARGKKDRVEELLAQGAHLDAVDKNGFSAMHYAAAANQTDSVAIAAILLAKRADIHASTRWGKTPLHVAAENGNTDMASFLVENDSQVNALNKDRRTPLHEAVEKNKKETVEFLLAHGTDVTAQDLYAETPLQTAERKGYADIATVLQAYATRGLPAGDDSTTFAAAEAGRRVATANPPDQLVDDVMSLVRRHRDDEAQLESALAHYFGAKERPARPVHPRVNPAGGFSIEHD